MEPVTIGLGAIAAAGALKNLLGGDAVGGAASFASLVNPQLMSANMTLQVLSNATKSL